ncbi:hypothetical protein CAPTEDRAFT_203444 [Capitella teleta]|uniref:Uncharacterized protein n=1 Tax=Capitella teleta TaxID=283909 RepID=R7VGP8_CAPTE|nr:hypothetical protein CAPTEDRAFT_203444 [Capitella teleta]|eukprot:ELU15491.1 hypothetical protein CAPTEDRAFT_203444 [Capitella teleta]
MSGIGPSSLLVPDDLRNCEPGVFSGIPDDLWILCHLYFATYVDPLPVRLPRYGPVRGARTPPVTAHAHRAVYPPSPHTAPPPIAPHHQWYPPAPQTAPPPITTVHPDLNSWYRRQVAEQEQQSLRYHRHQRWFHERKTARQQRSLPYAIPPESHRYQHHYYDPRHQHAFA